ncbi:MAG: hypothetical protein BRC33_08115 [Cyanobacteria bacterium SW_9_44_58]|nr:MAG: hypothetical protein BRC33_08115 [Cyanobacteria bacterium SW_9_44_58]
MMLQIICFCCSWGLIIFLTWSALRATIRGVKYVKTLHQIPCSRRAFFTNNYCLKCTVHPYEAGTELAINCQEFEPKPEIDTSNSYHQTRPYQVNI